MKFNVKRYFQVLGVSLAVIVAAAAVCMGVDFTGKNDIASVDNTSTVKVEGGKINVLLMGTDVDGLRTDAIMLASIDTEAKTVNMLTIPRDTEMYIGNRYQKINAAHAYIGKDGKIGGPTATCEAVTRITGIPINYYVDFTFDGVAHVINELGPIDFEIPDLYNDGVGMVYDDPVQSLHINLPPGKYGDGGDYPGLNGSQAVWLMRYRHGNVNPNTGTFKGYANGDKDRVEMQQKFIKAVVDQKVNAGLILKLPSIFKEVSSEIKTNLTIGDVIKYSKLITDFKGDSIHGYNLPGEYSTDKNGDVWIPDMKAIREMVETTFGYDASGITTGNPNDAESIEEGKSTKSSSSSDSSDSGKSSDSSSTSSSGSSSSSTSSSGSSYSGSSSLSSSESSSSGSSSSSSKSSSSSDDSDEDSGKSTSSSSSSSVSSSDDDDITTSEYEYEGEREDG